MQNSNTQDRIGYCLDLRDLFLAKAVAGREKDREFCMALLLHGYVLPTALLALVADMPLDGRAQKSLRATIRRWAKALRDLGHSIAQG
ncbi:hypothetical protein [Comamonas sp.]|uniref:hypothetical protein n=1 Tax=Comamonas sp. TaxID=34028 RepID=UPI003917E6D1